MPTTLMLPKTSANTPWQIKELTKRAGKASHAHSSRASRRQGGPKPVDVDQEQAVVADTEP